MNKEDSKSYNRERLREIMAILAKHDIVRGMTPLKLRRIIEDLGPTFVKLGQVLSMRQDILPLAYCKELEKLRTDVLPLSFEVVTNVIEEEFGKRLDEDFLSIDKEPLGSASIAQVHRAVLKNGEVVVVKVQRPGIKETMAQDIALLSRASRLLKIAGGTGNAVDFQMVLDELWFTAQQEMDFLIEAHNAERFYALNQDIRYVTCPRIYKNYTTTKVLVMEYIGGFEIDAVDTLKAEGYDLEEIATKLAENYIKQIIDDGFFHADPHPGNVRIQEGQIVWIDMGMMGSLTARDQELFKQVVEAVARQDVQELKTVILTLGVHSGRINHARLYADIEEMISEYGTLDFGSIDVAVFMENLLHLANTHHIAMPKGVTMLSRGVMTFEGLLLQLAPGLNMVQLMMNHLSKNLLEDLDLKEETTLWLREVYNAGKSAVTIPGSVADFLKMTLRGQTKINLELTGSEEPLDTIDQMVNKLISCIITAALLVGSSFIATTNMTPKILGIPALGFLGYLVSIILSGHTLFQIYRKKKKQH